ncbi:MAG: beta-lactamase family protein [Coriobacteriia bacterium]|nr:beta-lactamase family protein [Coriobacteriia bacterium]
MTYNTSAMARVFEKATDTRSIHGAVLLVENTSGEYREQFGYGNIDADSPIFTASIGKMYTASCLLQLCAQGRLSLDDPLDRYFDAIQLDGLHVFKGIDYSHQLIVSHLLFQNSGLGDIYEEGGAKKEAIQGDFSLSFEQKLERMKKLSPHFAPGDPRRAYYSDFNFDLLGKIIERLTGTPLALVYKELLFDPLGLVSTYLPAFDDDPIPRIYYRDELLHRPQVIRSFQAGGACVSTARETMQLLKAFWEGTFFPREMLTELAIYRKLQASMGPLRYGGGHMQIPLDGLATSFMGKGALIGHAGSTACAAFSYPHKDLHFVCDFNQMAKPALPVRTVMRLAAAS